MNEYYSPKWRKLFETKGLADFASLWRMNLIPLEKPNTGRGRKGWSTVGRLTLDSPEGKNRFIVKRQQNHFSRTLAHPIRGIPTFQREFNNIIRYQQLSIPTVETVYYGQRRQRAALHAILITEYLEDYIALDELVQRWLHQDWPKRSERDQLIETVATFLRYLHDKGLRHNCMYPKHLFVKLVESGVDLRVIDLEKSRWSPFKARNRIRDLGSLNRHARGWRLTDRVRFLKVYCGVDTIDDRARRLCRRLTLSHLKKGANKF